MRAGDSEPELQLIAQMTIIIRDNFGGATAVSVVTVRVEAGVRLIGDSSSRQNREIK